ASEFQEWIGEQRLQLHATYVAVLERLWGLESQPNRLTVAKKLVAQEPLKEAAHRMLMQAYAEAGEKGLAPRHYAACSGVVKREVGKTGGGQIEEVGGRIRDGVVSAPLKHLRSCGPADTNIETDNEVSPPTPSLSDKPSIAVLPFANLSGDPQQDYFADG